MGVLFTLPSVVGTFISSQPKLVLTLKKKFHELPDREECEEFHLLVVRLLRSHFVDEDDGDRCPCDCLLNLQPVRGSTELSYSSRLSISLSHLLACRCQNSDRRRARVSHRDVRGCLFVLAPKKKKRNRSVSTNILQSDMFFRCDTRKRKNYPMLTDIVLVRQDATRDRAPRWRWIVDFFFRCSRTASEGCQLTIPPAFENADGAFLVFFNAVVIFVFFALRPSAPLVCFF